MLKKHFKTFFFTILVIIFIAEIGFTAFSTYFAIQNSFEFKSENIDDAYGKLDANTRLILGDTLKKVMKENKVEIYFSYVYKDLNESYTNHLSNNNKAIFIYYNDNLKTLNVISKLQLKQNNFYKTLKETDSLDNLLPDYIDSVCNNITEKTNKMYIENNRQKVAILIITTAFLSILFFGKIIISYIKYMKSYISDLKQHKQEKLEKVELEKNQSDIKEVITDNDNDTEFSSSSSDDSDI